MTSARALHSSVLPTPVGPEEHERADRPIRILQAAAAAADRVGDRLDRFVLADDALVQAVFHDQQLGPLGFQHAGDRNAGPGADDFGDFLFGDFLAQQPPIGRLLAGRVLLRLRCACRSLRRCTSSSYSRW